MEAKWYRNEPEKEQDKPQGEGKIIHFGLLEQTNEGIAVIVDDKGNIHEKPFSLVRIVVNPEVRAIEKRLQEDAEQEYIIENTSHVPVYTQKAKLEAAPEDGPEPKSTPKKQK